MGLGERGQGLLHWNESPITSLSSAHHVVVHLDEELLQSVATGASTAGEEQQFAWVIEGKVEINSRSMQTFVIWLLILPTSPVLRSFSLLIMGWGRMTDAFVSNIHVYTTSSPNDDDADDYGLSSGLFPRRSGRLTKMRNISRYTGAAVVASVALLWDTKRRADEYASKGR